MDNQTILFICEHGSAKSVVAAAHFNQLARDRDLPYRAVARGTDPDQANHPAAVAALRAEGLHVEGDPQKLLEPDVQAAHTAISVGELPAQLSHVEGIEIWNVPPISEDYELARDRIVGHVTRLVDMLSSQR